ncbi:hypothetical protein ACZ11_01260 [Lysinibacillus xylanilyticus]|uniref:Uncharacterized protein n=1 Tax=Lysinibacillus xylanilyticus TaxID=582475 RepID=A0A0K9FGT5_9BACI|nr:hypothetical protein [Lysinibacillus xylanilyticus]KMY33739.1 hypothetical protein ACZ11_01260 [Lysinibacillus xylanilyticus]
MKKLQRNIRDNFVHSLSPLDEYVLYHIIVYVVEGSEDDFTLSDIINEFFNKEDIFEKLHEDEINILKLLNTPKDLIGLLFEDIDFLELGNILELYKKNPEIITDFFHINLEDYIELMPEDILKEYKRYI